MATVNLLQETISVIKTMGKLPEKIVFIGSRDCAYGCSWKQFQQLANFNYDNAAKGQMVAKDLTIVFSCGSSMTRVDDGSLERWTTEIIPPRPAKLKAISKLHDGADKSIADMNKV